MAELIRDTLLDYQEKKKKVFINGMPEEDGGTIIAVRKDFIEFEILKGDKKEDKTREVVNIPLAAITSWSEGAKKIETGLSAFKAEPKEEEEPEEEPEDTDEDPEDEGGNEDE